MSAFYGHPDDTTASVAHGEVLWNVANVTAPAAGAYATGALRVAAYQSIVIVVANYGGGAIRLLAAWDFRDSLDDTTTNQVRTIASGETKRFIFQNRGDRITDIELSGVTVDVQMGLYVQAANLPPFGSAHDWATMWSDPALGDANQVIGTGVQVALVMHHFKSAGGSFLFDAANSRIYPAEPGLYDCFAEVSWPVGGGAFYHEARIVASPGVAAGSLSATMNPGKSDNAGLVGYFDDEAVGLALLEAVDANTYFFAAAYQTSGVNQTLSQPRRFFVRKVGDPTETTI